MGACRCAYFSVYGTIGQDEAKKHRILQRFLVEGLLDWARISSRSSRSGQICNEGKVILRTSDKGVGEGCVSRYTASNAQVLTTPCFEDESHPGREGYSLRLALHVSGRRLLRCSQLMLHSTDRYARRTQTTLIVCFSRSMVSV